MPPPSSKTLSPAELAKLEHAFATDPASEAYKPLAEAYLGMGRFMEAMVVCKKGVKAHPNMADPRILLARVYADQGKDRKALEEIQAALGVSPKDKQALRIAGVLHFKLGETEPGKTHLLRSLEADPGDEETLSALREHKVEAPASAASQGGGMAPAAPAHGNNGNGQGHAHGAPQVPVAGPGTARPGAVEKPGPQGRVSGVLSPMQLPSSGVTSNQASRDPSAVLGEGEQSPRGQIEGARPSSRRSTRPPRPSSSVFEVDPEELIRQEAREVAERRAQNARKQKVFMGLLLLSVLGAGVYFVVGQQVAKKNRERDRLLTVVRDELGRDSYDSYKKASDAAEKVLDVDSSSAYAHAYLAYAYTIRWGEHGGGDAARKKAEQHLAEAKANDADPSWVGATEALLQSYSGKGAEARAALEERVKAFEAAGKPSPLLLLTLGILQMNLGDLDAARESLVKASSIANDARIFSAMGTLYRRRGQTREAKTQFEFALKYERNHPESLLGLSLLLLDAEEPDFASAAEKLKLLLDSSPPPSPRQLAAAHLARSFLISRVSRELPLYTSADYQKELSKKTGVSMDPAKARAEMLREEEQGFSLDRKNPELHLIKGRRLIVEEKFDEAVNEIRQAIQMDPSRAFFYVELARALMSKPGGEKEAAEALGTALKSMGDNPKLTTMLGDAYRKMGRNDDALAQYTQAVSASGAKNVEARLAMGRIYREKRDYGKAGDAFDKAAQDAIGQPARVAEAFTELGRVFDEKGDRGKSEEFFQKALRADAEFAPGYCHYARLLAQDRRTERKAREVAQEYLRLDPKGDCAADAQRIAQR